MHKFTSFVVEKDDWYSHYSTQSGTLNMGYYESAWQEFSEIAERRLLRVRPIVRWPIASYNWDTKAKVWKYERKKSSWAKENTSR